MKRMTCALLVLSGFACSKPPPKPPKEVPLAKPLNAEPPPPSSPKVDLPPAPALPSAPAGLSSPASPGDNPTTPERAALGAQLFFDKRMSSDGSMACVSCHLPEKSWTSGNALDAKVGGTMNKRNASTVLNLGFHTSYYWDGRASSLEAVSNAAWRGQLGAEPDIVCKAFNDIPVYKASFDRAFGGTEGATGEKVAKALAAFFRTLNTGNSAWDKFTAGDKKALSKDAQAGWALFQKAKCIGCHVPPLFSDYDFHNVGIGDDPGRKDTTKADADLGKFKTPTLRGVAKSAPYFHDGNAKTLEDAITFMAKGGGKKDSDPKLKAFKVGKKEVGQLKAYLESLTGEASYTKAPALP
jgi:cytochrome c peroxidase